MKQGALDDFKLYYEDPLQDKRKAKTKIKSDAVEHIVAKTLDSNFGPQHDYILFTLRRQLTFADKVLADLEKES